MGQGLGVWQGSHRDLRLNPALPCVSCVTLGRFLGFSEPLFSHL